MDIINVPIGWILKGCSMIAGGNYLVAILLFALLFEIILLPFGIKQQKNSIKQARLRPKEMAIRKKYAGRDDQPTQQKMTQEIQELYQKEGYNPLSGCLPLLIQLPILFALFSIVTNPLKYICGLSDAAIQQISSITGIPVIGGQTMPLLNRIHELKYDVFKNVEGFTEDVFNSVPNLKIFEVFDISLTPKDCITNLGNPTSWLILSIPVLTFFAYFFSTKISRKLTYQPMNDAQQAQAGCSNKVMDIAMPLMSVYFSFMYPAALGVYWIFKSLLGVVKQVILYYVMPLPKFTDEDYKAAEKEVGTARLEKNMRVQKSGKVVRSLHHIDDEDFEDTAEAGRLRREALEAQEAAEREAKQANAAKKKGVVAAAPIKEDDRNEKNAESEKKNDE